MAKPLFLFIFFFFISAQNIDSLINKMSIDEKIGQLFMIEVNPNFLSVYNEDYKRIKKAITKYHVGGLILHGGETIATAFQLNEWQKISKLPLLISSDLERGLFQQMPNGIQFPPNMAIAASNDPKNAYLQGKITAREARAIGIHMILAPVLDINDNPKNPIINFRSYGETPEIVSKFGIEMIKGLQENGVIATAKHFPGHGNTDKDSHIELPILNKSLQELNKNELIPFKKAINNDVKAIMTAHIALPKLHQDKKFPATASKFLLTNILRKKLGFNGIIISDGLNMRGLSGNKSAEKMMIDIINAGVDILLMPEFLPRAFKEIKRAFLAGKISKKRLHDALHRQLLVKKELHLFQSRKTNLSSIKFKLENINSRRSAKKIAKESLSMIHQSDETFRFSTNDKIFILAVSSEKSLEKPGFKFTKKLQEFYPNTKRLIIDLRTHEDEIFAMRDSLKNADQIIVALFSRTRAGKETIGLDEVRQNYIRFLTQAYKEKTISVSFGSPYIASDFSFLPNHIAAFSYSSLMQKTVAETFAYGNKIEGEIPVRVPNLHEKLQHNSDFSSLAEIFKKAIKDSVFPGAAIAIGNHKGILYKQAYGNFTYDKKSEKVEIETRYDLASLTKIFATTLAVMKLVDDKQLNLENSLGKFFPDLDSLKMQIKIKHILSHSSGLLWHKKFYEEISGKDSIITATLNLPLANKIAEKTKYSDLGFIILMKIIEKISGENFGKFVSRNFYEKMELENTSFNPDDKNKIPPTEKGFFHKKLAQGIVHDGNAAAMGGISGHAGLFSSIEDLSKIAQMLLNYGFYENEQLIKTQTVRNFFQKAEIVKGSTRAFGFDTPSPVSLAGKYISDQAVGHTGFTGTSFWIDPKNDVFIILLSNRVYPTRKNQKISKFRPRFHNRVMEVLGKTKLRDSYKKQNSIKVNY